jgi:prepilin signal peptidase PulO-like enzyme (type II secretory pathway)
MIVFIGTFLGLFIDALIRRAIRCVGIYAKNYNISNFSYVRLYRAVSSYLIFGTAKNANFQFSACFAYSFIFFGVCLSNYFFNIDIFPQFALLLVFCLLLVISLIDYKTKLIPDFLSYAVFWLGAFVQYKQGGQQLIDGLIVALVVYISLKSLQQIYLLGFGRDALGDADPLLAFSIAVWLDYWHVPYLFLLAVFVTLLPILFFTRLKSSLLTMQIPFGPGLAIAGFFMIELKFLTP